jgi:hypothetical protein
VEALKAMADNTITVSAIDRSIVQVNGTTKVDREKAILALSVGDQYVYKASSADLKFFFDVEVASNGALIGVAAFTTFAYGLFLASFWDSSPESAALVVVAASIIAFFCLNPYLLALTDWRNYMSEEAEALLRKWILATSLFSLFFVGHFKYSYDTFLISFTRSDASKSMNKALKSLLTLLLIVIVSAVEYGCINAVVDGLEDVNQWIAMLLDSASLTFPFMFFGLYTKLPFQAVQIFASMPFLFMIFFSTTFSPGSGVEGVKELRYLFARFYWFCIVPGVQDQMEGCPGDDVLMLYMFLAAMVGLVMFLVYQTAKTLYHSFHKQKAVMKRNALKDDEFRDLQLELYGEEILGRTQHSIRSVESHSSAKSGNKGKHLYPEPPSHDDEQYVTI